MKYNEDIAEAFNEFTRKLVTYVGSYLRKHENLFNTSIVKSGFKSEDLVDGEWGLTDPNIFKKRHLFELNCFLGFRKTYKYPLLLLQSINICLLLFLAHSSKSIFSSIDYSVSFGIDTKMYNLPGIRKILKPI